MTDAGTWPERLAALTAAAVQRRERVKLQRAEHIAARAFGKRQPGSA